MFLKSFYLFITCCIFVTPSFGFSADRVINGVNGRTISDLYDFLLRNPKIGVVTYSNKTQWQEGMKSVSTFERYKIDGQPRGTQNRKFTVLADEITELGGTDSSPAPVEYLLHAMSSCIIAVGNLKAVQLGVTLKQFEVTMEADVDLHGIMDIDSKLRMGIKDVRTKITIAGDGSDVALKKIAQYGYDFAPTMDTVEKSFPKPPAPEITVVKPLEKKP